MLRYKSVMLALPTCSERFSRQDTNFFAEMKKDAKQIRRSPNPDSGFTLLEIMVALAMIAIVLVAVYRMQTQTINMNIVGRFQTVAPFLAQKIMADIEAKPAEELFDNSGDFGESFPELNWTVTVEELVSETFGEIGKDLKRINVTISSAEQDHCVDADR